ETNVVGRVHVDLDVHLVEQARLGEDENAFDDDDRLRLDVQSLFATRVCLEVVERQLDGLATFWRAEVTDGEVVVDGARVIEVDDVPDVERELIEVAVVRVLLKKDDFVLAHRFENTVRHRRLT